MRLIVAGIALTALAGCATATLVADAAGACDATKVAGVVGKVADDAVVRQAQRDAGAKAVRVIAPGMAVTMDYREDRLNIEVDAGRVVTAVRCG